MLKIRLSTIFFLFLNLPAWAEDLPEYEGVYLETTDGFVELSPLPSFYSRPQHIFFDDGEPIVACISMECIPHSFGHMFQISDLIDAPTVDGNAILRVASNGVGVDVLGLRFVVSTEQYFGSKLDEARLSLTSSGILDESLGGNRSLVPISSVGGLLVDSNWGFNAGDNSIRKRNIDNFNAKFDFQFGFSGIGEWYAPPHPLDIESAQRGVVGQFSACPNTCEVLLFLLETNQGSFPFFTETSRNKFNTYFGIGD